MRLKILLSGHLLINNGQLMLPKDIVGKQIVDSVYGVSLLFLSSWRNSFNSEILTYHWWPDAKISGQSFLCLREQREYGISLENAPDWSQIKPNYQFVPFFSGSCG